MASIDSDTARVTASVVLPRSLKQATPTSAERILPSSTLRGCAKGLFGAAYSSTDVAPNEATISSWWDNQWALSKQIAPIPLNAPSQDQRASCQSGLSTRVHSPRILSK